MPRSRGVLFTNLDLLIFETARIPAHAVLIQETTDSHNQRSHRLMAMYYDVSLPTFELAIPSLEYRLQPIRGPEHAVEDERLGLRPGEVAGIDTPEARFASRSALYIAGFPPTIDLLVHDIRSAIAIDEVDGEVFSLTWRLNDIIRRRIAQFMQSETVPEVRWVRRKSRPPASVPTMDEIETQPFSRPEAPAKDNDK